jgi:hypothetical protein
MAYNFVTNTKPNTVSHCIVAELLSSFFFPALKQNLGGGKFKSNRVVENFVTRWLMTQDTD